MGTPPMMPRGKQRDANDVEENIDDNLGIAQSGSWCTSCGLQPAMAGALFAMKSHASFQISKGTPPPHVQSVATHLSRSVPRSLLMLMKQAVPWAVLVGEQDDIKTPRRQTCARC